MGFIRSTKYLDATVTITLSTIPPTPTPTSAVNDVSSHVAATSMSLDGNASPYLWGILYVALFLLLAILLVMIVTKYLGACLSKSSGKSSAKNYAQDRFARHGSSSKRTFFAQSASFTSGSNEIKLGVHTQVESTTQDIGPRGVQMQTFVEIRLPSPARIQDNSTALGNVSDVADGIGLANGSNHVEETGPALQGTDRLQIPASTVRMVPRYSLAEDEIPPPYAGVPTTSANFPAWV